MSLKLSTTTPRKISSSSAPDSMPSVRVLAQRAEEQLVQHEQDLVLALDVVVQRRLLTPAASAIIDMFTP